MCFLDLQVDRDDAKRALDSYLSRGLGTSPSSSSHHHHHDNGNGGSGGGGGGSGGSQPPFVVGKFGVKSPWFLGVDVVTNNPVYPDK